MKPNPSKFTPFMNEKKPNTYTQYSKLSCDCGHKKKYLILYRMLKFYVRHGMKVEKVHEITSFKQRK